MIIVPSESELKTKWRIAIASVSPGLIFTEILLIALAGWWLWQAHVDPSATYVTSSKGLYGNTDARSIADFFAFLALWIPIVAWFYHQAGRPR